MSDNKPMRRSQSFLWQGVAAGALGLLLLAGEIPLGYLLLVVGGMLLFAGLIGEAVRGPEDRA